MKNISLIAFISLFWLSCGPGPEQDIYDDESKTSTFTRSGGGQATGPSEVTIPIAVDYGAFGLMATAATAWSVTLDDDPVSDAGGASTCLSAYTATVTQVNADGVEVYKDDRDCLAKLTSFTTGGTVYNSTNAGATNFTTWLANDTAIFADAGANTIRVKVISQLGSPIAGTEAIVYNFSEVLDGTGDYTYTEASVSDPHAITVESQEAPQFDVIAATFLSMDDTTGAPEFTFQLECVDDPTAVTPTSIAMTDGTWTDDRCSTVDLVDIDYKLVKDTYSSTLTVTEAETIFGSAGDTITQTTDQYQTSSTQEGFNTVTLDGPGGLGVSGNENMILIIRAGLSFTYYNIDVTIISQ